MPKEKKTKRRPRYKNEAFLRALGSHCRQLRIQRGYSIDRLAKESEQLSPASIDRLERGMADSQVLVLIRYAEVLGLSILDLFTFLKDNPSFSKDPRIIPYDPDLKPPAGSVPVYPIKVAAGIFSDDDFADDAQPIGWIEAGIKIGAQDYFASFAYGDSMKPVIEDGDLCLFRRYTGGSRQGKTFLIEAHGVKNSETGESYVVKKYLRQTPPRTASDETPATIHLISENPRFAPIILVGLSDDDIRVIAEFIKVL